MHSPAPPETLQSFSFRLNGEEIEIHNLHPNTTLLDWLHSRDLTAAKEGCAEGDCGACTVIVVDTDINGKRVFRAINSCIALLPTLAGREIITVEGMARDGMHPAQKAMVDCYGSQCGYCTPGFVASIFEGCYRREIESLDALNDHLCGNLCRCTGYRAIRSAALAAWKTANPEDTFGKMLEAPAQNPSRFNYEACGGVFLRPDSLENLFQAIEEYPDARLIAGGTELGVDVARLFKRYPVLISLQAVRELQTISEKDGVMEIGAGAVLTDVMNAVCERIPSLHHMLRLFASRPIRNRATLGGNLVTASPIGDTAPVLLSLNATVVLTSAKGEREIPLSSFFTGYRRTVLKPGEILRAVRIPLTPSPGTARRLARSFKISKRREMDISIVAAGMCVDLDAQNHVIEARLAFGGVAPTPALAPRTMEFLRGRVWDSATVQEAAHILREEFNPIDDVRASADYRRAVAADLLRAFFENPECRQDDLPLEDLPPAPKLPTPPHESGHRHVTGEARYVDEEARRRGALTVWPICSPHAHARILRRDATRARAVPGVAAVLLAEDVPGLNDIGASVHDEILLADKEVFYHGHPVAIIVGETPEVCREAATLMEIAYEPLPPLLTIREALAAESFLTEPSAITRGDAESALRNVPHILEGEFSFGGQEHFYLETQAAWAEWTEDDMILVHTSTQHPSEIQTIVAHVLGWPRHRIIAHSPRMGGGFGGKETQGAGVAVLSALATWHTGRPCRMRLNRDQDFQITGKRHPFLARFRVGFRPDGTLLAADVELFANGGWSLDLSRPICDRALFHLDNAYYIPNVRFCGRVCRTNLASNTAFRGFGGPQGMLVIEEIMDRVARHTGLRPETVRERNMYHGTGETNTTHYGQEIGDNRLCTIWNELKKQSRFDERRDAVARFNEKKSHIRRGIAIIPVKFGISFTHTPFNQAGALVLIYADGTVQVNHGGTEMGQGLYTKILGVASRELGLDPSRIRVMQTRTDKVPNTSATAASSGSDLNGAAVRNACETLRERLAPLAAEMLSTRGVDAQSERIQFQNGAVHDSTHPPIAIPFEELVAEAYIRRISLSATGYYRTPEIYYDREKGRGRPFYYFACGAAVSEVEVDGFTGQMRLVRVDILHDVGESLNEGIDRGQIEGGFIQGMGWLTSEELRWSKEGKLLSHGASTYQIPTIGDVPAEFHIRLLPNAAQPGTIHGSKAVGEPPLMLAISVREAIRDAVAAFGAKEGEEIPLGSPATCEAIYRAIHRHDSMRNASPPPEV